MEKKESLVPSDDFSGFSWSILLFKVSLKLVKKYSSLKMKIKGKSFPLKILKKVYKYKQTQKIHSKESCEIAESRNI